MYFEEPFLVSVKEVTRKNKGFVSFNRTGQQLTFILEYHIECCIYYTNLFF